MSSMSPEQATWFADTFGKLSANIERAVVGNVATLAELMPALATAGVRAVSASGVLGDPTGATAAEGERLLGSMVGEAARRLSGRPAARSGSP